MFDDDQGGPRHRAGGFAPAAGEPLIECVPNFSEGRDPETLRLLGEAIAGSPGVVLLDRTADADHHRSVFTFAGRPEAAVEALLAAARVAVERIDLRAHRGAHPRIGALDVAPFVPLRGLSWEQAIAAARSFGERLAGELGVPVFYYGRAATRPKRERLENIRRGGFEALVEAAAKGTPREPDVGGPAPHPTAGATAVGVRKPLVAFNVNLRTADPGPARRIARLVRESSGGYPTVKALGLELPERGLTQVSMNLTDYEVASPSLVFERIREEATREGVEIVESELIGLIPRAALKPLGPEGLRLSAFTADRILEDRLPDRLP